MLCFRSRFTQVPEWSKGEVLRSSAKAPGFEICECPSLSSCDVFCEASLLPSKEECGESSHVEVAKAIQLHCWARGHAGFCVRFIGVLQQHAETSHLIFRPESECTPSLDLCFCQV